jgi:hypothetical protein
VIYVFGKNETISNIPNTYLVVATGMYFGHRAAEQRLAAVVVTSPPLPQPQSTEQQVIL